MSYCIKCGVELSEYMKKCPLCKTKVIRLPEDEKVINTDYPDYRINPRKETIRVNHLFVGKLLSMLFFNYAVLLVLINIIVNNKVSWSMIPIISLALLWICVAYPFLRKQNSLFLLFTVDSIATIIYLLTLNFIISGNFAWAIFASIGIALLWVIFAGYFLSEKIEKVLPVAVYYIFALLLFFVIITLFIENKILEIQIVLPISVLILIISLMSYFIIIAKARDLLGIVSVILFDVSIFCLVLDILLSHYLKGTIVPSWSILVNAITIPLFATIHTIKKGRQLRAIISKKMHR